jgi:hypothetical protein
MQCKKEAGSQKKASGIGLVADSSAPPLFFGGKFLSSLNKWGGQWKFTLERQSWE